MDNTINGKIAKQVFGFMWEEGKTADEIIAEKGLKQETDTAQLKRLLRKYLLPTRRWLKSINLVKRKPLTVLVGQVMKAPKR